MKLTLAGQMVEHANYPGQATSLLGLANYSPDYSKGCWLIQEWTPDINADAAVANTGFAVRQRFLIQSPDPKDSFQCTIPMRHIFGFTDDYTKVTYGMRDTLQLIRKDDNDAFFRTAAAAGGKVVLSTKRCAQSKSVQEYCHEQHNPCSFYLKQDPPSGDWVLALHRKNHDGYWSDCKQASVVTRKEMLPFFIIAT